jgi:predicted ester cyclase
MSIEEDNKAKQRRVWEDVINKGNIEIIPELFAPSYFSISPLGMDIKGPEGFKQSITMIRKAFPDVHFTIDDMLAIDDKVVTRFTLTCTFKGEIMGITPTGKKATIAGIVITRWVDGKEVEAWDVLDTLGFYQQLGIPIPSQ